MNQGYRKDSIRSQVKHLNGFYEILDQLEEVYQKMIVEGHEPIDNNNIDHWCDTYMGRPLDSIEMMVIRGKLGLETKLKEDESGDNT